MSIGSEIASVAEGVLGTAVGSVVPTPSAIFRWIKIAGVVALIGVSIWFVMRAASDQAAVSALTTQVKAVQAINTANLAVFKATAAEHQAIVIQTNAVFADANHRIAQAAVDQEALRHVPS